MQAVLTPDCRPTCLIIDEIDGAPTVSFVVLKLAANFKVCTCEFIFHGHVVTRSPYLAW